MEELHQLRTLIAQRTPLLVGIDGMNGVGKSRRVSKHLGMPVIAVDDFLKGNRRYLEGIDYERLSSAVRFTPGPKIIEGCCLLEVTKRLSEVVDLHVYVRRVTEQGFWHDAEVGEGEMLEYVISHNRAVARAARVGFSNLDQDLAVYHAEYRPYQSADLVVDLVERPAD